MTYVHLNKACAFLPLRRTVYFPSIECSSLRIKASLFSIRFLFTQKPPARMVRLTSFLEEYSPDLTPNSTKDVPSCLWNTHYHENNPQIKQLFTTSVFKMTCGTSENIFRKVHTIEIKIQTQVNQTHLLNFLHAVAQV